MFPAAMQLRCEEHDKEGVGAGLCPAIASSPGRKRPAAPLMPLIRQALRLSQRRLRAAVAPVWIERRQGTNGHPAASVVGAAGRRRHMLLNERPPAGVSFVI